MTEPAALPRGRVGLAVAGLVAVLLLAFAQGLGSDLFAEGGLILELAWGRALMLDLYVGLLLFALWILWREPSRGIAAGWIVALLLLGNVVACLYVLLVLRASAGQPGRFWNGPA